MTRLAMFPPLATAALLAAAWNAPAVAQAGTTPAQPPRHPPVCAKGVRTYPDFSQVPKPYDTLAMPPGPRIQVTNPEEAEAAERAVRERAGSIGATGVVFTEETSSDGAGAMEVRRRVFPVFVPSDSARAQQACS